ncbi:non-specific lipid transfer protein GPI-anchored 9-like [Tasmannia lanceolata]|uniref:non-specific lipid transfer protein GPI-anchored 9-like n=1 Tax=Tasmannia lanceolata TaxID=3420 RepID=UPI004062D285
MGSSRFSNSTVLLLLLVLVAFILAGKNGVSGQQTQACASKLVPCADFVNSTNPPVSCCGPLTDAVRNDLPCLCNLLKNPAIFASFRINITQALELPKYCGLTSGIEACNRAPPPATGAPPGTPGRDGSSAGKMEWVGMSTITGFLILLWASIMA